MTYKEFKELIEREHGYVVEQQDGFCTIRNDKTDATIVLINLYKRHIVDTYFLTDDEDMRFMAYNWNTISEFVATPVEERYPVKKYYVKLDTPEFLDKQNRYLNKVNYAWIYPEINYKFDTKSQSSDYQTQFTMEEIEEIIPKEDMDKFKFIPVEEDKE